MKGSQAGARAFILDFAGRFLRERKMKYANLSVAVILVLIVLAAFSYARNTYSSYRNQAYGFTIQFPDGWTIKEGVASGTIVNAVNRDELGNVAMVSINAQRLAQGEDYSLRNTSPEEVFESARRQLVGQGITMMLLDSGVTSINGEYAIWHKYSMKMSQVMDKVCLSYNIPRDRNLFILAGSANPEMYPEVEPILKESITSLHFETSSQVPNVRNTKSGESWLMSLLKAYGKVFLLMLATGAGIAIVKYIIHRSKKQKQEVIGTNRSSPDRTLGTGEM